MREDILIKKAMVMAAGVGSRLEPLTNDVPKPLVPVLNKPVMDILLQKLKMYGVESVIANTHYLAEKIQDRYASQKVVDIDFSYVNEDELSGTAGGVKKCEFFFEDVDDFIVVSADGLHDADIGKIVKSHLESGCIATMAIVSVDREEVSKYGVVVPSENHTVVEFQEKPPLSEAKSNYINTGIYVFKKRIFDFIPENTVFDFARDVFPALLKAGEQINVYRIYSYWSDVGTIDQYIQSNKDALAKKIMIPNSDIVRRYDSVSSVGKNTRISDTAKLLNNVVIGQNCIIEEDAVLDNVILWDNVIVEKGVHLKNVVCGNDCIFKSSVIAGDFDFEIFESKRVVEFSIAE